MTIWRQAGRVSFASSQDFLLDDSISKNCRDSYEKYILKTRGEDLPVNKKGYSITEWDYIDYENNARYVASWNKDFAWSVMKTPIPKEEKGEGQAKAQQQIEDEIGPDPNEGQPKAKATITATKGLLTDNEAANRIVELLEAILQHLTEKGIKRASDM